MDENDAIIGHWEGRDETERFEINNGDSINGDPRDDCDLSNDDLRYEDSINGDPRDDCDLSNDDLRYEDSINGDPRDDCDLSNDDLKYGDSINGDPRDDCDLSNDDLKYEDSINGDPRDDCDLSDDDLRYDDSINGDPRDDCDLSNDDLRYEDSINGGPTHVYLRHCQHVPELGDLLNLTTCRTSGSGDVGLYRTSGSRDVGLYRTSGSGYVGLYRTSGSGDVGLYRTSGSRDVGLYRTFGSGYVGLYRTFEFWLDPTALWFLVTWELKLSKLSALSITVDLKKPEGVKLIKELAAVSDVLIENFIPGNLAELGLGYTELSTEFPHLIYCSITGYGQTGEYATRAGYDVIVSGIGGLMNITGPYDGEPCKVGVALTDLSTGLYAVSAILASLISRQKTGRGQHIDCNLLSTCVASLVNVASNYLNTGQEGRRYGTAHPSIVPYQAFQTSDGYIIVGAGNDNQFKTLAELIGHPTLAFDEKYLTNKARVQNREELLEFLFKVQKTGRGQHIDCNLLSTCVASLVNVASNYLNTGQEGRRYGTAHPSIVPYQAFQTSDGYIIVGAGNDNQFKTLAELIGHPTLAFDEKYLTNKARVQNREELLEFLFKVFKEKSLSTWLKIFENSSIPYGPINNLEQVFSDPQVLQNGLVQEIQHPTIGSVRVAGPAVRYSEIKTVDPTPPPLLGQHTYHVLKDILGYSDVAISKLQKLKVV
ncbi:hypothetical protein Btru_034713 [Bulinus truncatus]|nr:hypothetical protein Btru_034713 [Bulinus truncatus]